MAAAAITSFLLAVAAAGATDPTAPTHGVRPATLLIRDVRVIRGNGTPPLGPTDVFVRGNVIEAVGRHDG